MSSRTNTPIPFRPRRSNTNNIDATMLNGNLEKNMSSVEVLEAKADAM